MLLVPRSADNSQQSLIERYQALSPNHKNCVRLLAVAYRPVVPTQLRSCLHELGTNVGVAELKPILMSLQTSGLLDRVQEDFQCKPEVAEIVTRMAVRDGSFSRLAQVVNRHTYVTRYTSAHRFEEAVSKIRIAFYRQDFGMLEMQLSHALYMFPEEYASRNPLLQLMNPFDPEWLALLPPTLGSIAVHQSLQSSFDRMVEDDAVFTWLRIDDKKSDYLRYRFGVECLLRGEGEEAAAILTNQDFWTMNLLRGWVAFLDGDLDGSLKQFDASLKQYRAVAGKKKLLLPDQGGLVHLFALLQANRPAQMKQAATYLSVLKTTGSAEMRAVAEVISDISTLRRGESIPPPDGDPAVLTSTRYRWLAFFFGLREYWRDSDAAKRLTPRLAALHKDAGHAGYKGFAAEVAALLHRLSPQDYAAPSDGLHRLVDIMPQQRRWERTLAALAALSDSGGKAPEVKRTGALRLAWFLRMEDLQIEPREQKQDARGGWNLGRPVTLKRLFQDGAGMQHLSPQDRQICQCIRGESPPGYTTLRYFLDGQDAMKALVGHPYVFSAEEPHLPLEVLRGEPELRVRKNRGTLDLSIFPMPVPRQEIAVVIETETRLRIIPFTEEHHKIARLLESGLQVPFEASAQVAAAIIPLSSTLTIHSDLDLGRGTVRQVPVDPALYANLVPCQGGLKVRLVAQPLGPEGPALVPGRGGPTVMAEVGKQRLQTRRDLPAEQRLMATVQGRCPTLSTAEERSGEWLVAELEECLELLSELQAQAPQVITRWPEGQPLKLAGEAAWKDMRIRVERQRDWFVANGEVSLDDGTVIDLQRLLTLANQGHGRFVPLGDGQFMALTDEFRRRLRELRTCADEHGKAIRLHPLAAPAVERITAGAGTLTSDKGWKDQVRRLQQTSEAAVPTTLQAELRPYQEDGFRWLVRLSQWGVGACLADDMGLGKTLQALALMLLRAGEGPALVIAPASVCMNWLNEANRFAPTLRPRFFGNGDRQAILSSAGPRDLVICSYGLLHQESEALARVRWHTLVLDEAQAIKNVSTRRSHAAKSLQADFRLVTTGTPVENHVGELWNLFDFLNPGLLGSHESFNRRFAGPIERDSDPTARSVLKQLIQPYILRRLKSQVLEELPTRTEILLQVEPSAEEQALLEALRRQAVDRLDSTGTSTGENHLRILAEIMKLRRACCHPRLVLPETEMAGSKLAVFSDLVDELRENRHRALVFSQFVDHLAILRAALDAKGVTYQYLDGSTPLAERQKRVDAFQSGQGDVFLISLRAGGVGLNLTAADYVIHMDPWWNPAVEDQAADRAHRIGQLRPVTIYRLVLKGSIEEQIVALHREKRDLADHLLEGTDTAGKLSADELLRLLKG